MRSIHCDASSPLDFDRVIALITRRYPGTRIVEADWYAERHAEDLELFTRIGDVPNPLLESLERVWAEKGLQRGFNVPIHEGLTLYARFDKTGGSFFCREGEFDGQAVVPLMDLLQDFGLRVQCYGTADPRG